MTDDVKALAERLLERMKSKTGQQIDGRYAPSFYMEWDAILDRKAADMLTRLASQREDVIDREAIARTLWNANVAQIPEDDFDDPASWDELNEKIASEECRLDFADWHKELVANRDYWLALADAIIRSLPSREAIIEAVKAKIGSHMSDRLVDLKPEMDALRIMRDVTELVELRSAPVFKATQNTAESDPFVRLDCAGADTVAAQPRSNSVEDGAGRNGSEDCSPQKAVIDTEQSGHVPSQTPKGI